MEPAECALWLQIHVESAGSHGAREEEDDLGHTEPEGSPENYGDWRWSLLAEALLFQKKSILARSRQFSGGLGGMSPEMRNIWKPQVLIRKDSSSPPVLQDSSPMP